MTATRKVKQIFQSKQTLEGAGVHLKRAFGFSEVPLFDPFLLFDDFRSDIPEHYLNGFPWHPHRGIETITYVLTGDVEHGDSLGNKGIISSGDIQWMTAGSGIIHQEMPKGDKQGRMHGFQLWVNLPAGEKMIQPRYRGLTSSQIPTVTLDNSVSIKIISGEISGVRGPVEGITINPEYLDITMPPDTEFRHPVAQGHTVFAYVIDGVGYPLEGKENGRLVDNGTIVLFDDGEEIQFITREKPMRFLMVSGLPLREPVAWRGPIVMNTQEELEIAFDEYRQGTFIKHND